MLRYQFPDDEAFLAAIPFGPPEEYWSQPLARPPGAARWTRAFLDDDTWPTAAVVVVPDEDIFVYWTPAPLSRVVRAFTDDEVVVSVVVPFTPDDDIFAYWTQAALGSQRVRAFTDDETWAPASVPPGGGSPRLPWALFGRVHARGRAR